MRRLPACLAALAVTAAVAFPVMASPLDEPVEYAPPLILAPDAAPKVPFVPERGDLPVETPVSDLEVVPISAPVKPGADLEIMPISAPGDPEKALVVVEGPVVWEDLEGGFYAVGGWRLVGDQTLFERYLGHSVVVTGVPDDGPSIFMVRALRVTEIRPADEIPGGAYIDPIVVWREVSADRAVPETISVNGNPVTFDVPPQMIDGVLMMPVRAIAEAMGATVEWNGEVRSVQVRTENAWVQFVIGREFAERSEDGVYYFAPNEIALIRAPVIVDDRTLIPADALTTVFGLVDSAADQAHMNLTALTPEPAADWGVVEGTIEQIQVDAETTRILVTGEAMANGEPARTWITLTEDAAIQREDDGALLPVAAQDLSPGLRVRAALAGPMLMSYPAKGLASELIILDDEIDWGTGEGVITQVTDAGSFRVLVNGDRGEEDLTWWILSDETLILVEESGALRTGTTADLTVGSRAHAVYSGPMLLSFPGRVGVSTVTVFR